MPATAMPTWRARSLGRRLALELFSNRVQGFHRSSLDCIPRASPTLGWVGDPEALIRCDLPAPGTGVLCTCTDCNDALERGDGVREPGHTCGPGILLKNSQQPCEAPIAILRTIPALWHVHARQDVAEGADARSELILRGAWQGEPDDRRGAWQSKECLFEVQLPHGV